MAREQKTCWQRGACQPLGMAAGSLLNLCGATASLVISAQGGAINPLPLICTSMITSGLYFTTNAIRVGQIWLETEEKEPNYAERVTKEREKITVTIER